MESNRTHQPPQYGGSHQKATWHADRWVPKPVRSVAAWMAFRAPKGCVALGLALALAGLLTAPALQQTTYVVPFRPS